MASTRVDGSLRPLREGDEQALAELWVRAWAETMPAIDFEARRSWIFDFLVEGAARSRATIVADKAERPIGFVTIEPAKAYLHQLAVAPDAKGSGVATLLLGAAKDAAPAGLTLDVNQANTRAARFYEREGFSKIGDGMNQASGLATWRLRWDPQG